MFIREVSSKEAQITRTRLKLPIHIDDQNLNSAKWEIDDDTLDLTSYEYAMIEELFASGAVPMDNPHSRVLLLGLKSGYIKSYLYKHFPNIVLTVVEKDREMLDIALTYFHMRIKSDYAVIIKDPVEYVNKAGGQKYDAIIIDVCKRGKNGKNPTCPMDEMYADQMVKKLASMLNRDGIIVINVLAGKDSPAAQKTATKATAEKLKKAFEKSMCECKYIFPSEEVPNMVLKCCSRKEPKGLREKFQDEKYDHSDEGSSGSRRSGKPNKPGRSGSPDKPSKPGKPNKPDRPESPNKSGRPGSPNKPGRSGSPNKPGKPGSPNKQSRPGSPNKQSRPGSPKKKSK